tara:strand:+ start:688 stop:1809 length:1122 start_codon:yes stop_codon:yes gene_type:complete
MQINNSVLRYALLLICTLFFLYASTYYYYYNKSQFNNDNMAYHMSSWGGPKISEISFSNPKHRHYLYDYHIMSSFNSCCAGDLKNDYVDTKPLINTISRGVRCLDFEIFQKDGLPVVAAGLGRDKAGQCLVKGTYNQLPVSEVFDTIERYAFSNSVAPNANDPLFLHFRFCTTKTSVYRKLAKAIQEAFGMRLLGPKLGNNGKYWTREKNMLRQKILDLRGKVIIMVSDPTGGYKKSGLTEFINLSDSMPQMQLYRNYDVQFNHDTKGAIEFNKRNITVSIPDISYKVMNNFANHKDVGIQFICINYGTGTSDSNLEAAHRFFNDQGTAFVLKDEDMRWKDVAIKNPKQQDKRVSMEAKDIELPAGIPNNMNI